VTSPISGNGPAAHPDAIVTETSSPPSLRLRDDRDFRRYWASRVLSLAGTLFSYIAMPVLVYRLSGSAVLTALVTSLEALPYVAFGLFAGVLSDRVDRRRLMVVADVVNAAVVATVPTAYWLGALSVPHVMAVAFVVPAIAVFFDGANFGALPVLVGRDRIAQANAAVWGTQTVAEIALPAAVGVLLAVAHPATLMAVDAVSYLVSASLIARIGRYMHDPHRARTALTVRAVVAEIGEGLRFLVGHAGVRTMTLIGGVNCVSAGGFVALMVVWCDQVLDIGTQGLRFGLVYGSWSIGALAATAALPRLLRRATAARIALLALPASAVFGVLAALTTQWQLAALGLLAWSCAFTLNAVNSISYRQQVTPEPLMGRVNTAGRMLGWGIGWSLGGAVGGVLGHVVGIRPALVVMASLVVVAVVIGWTSPLRGLMSPVEVGGRD
jgi:hypothetical protein